MRNPIVRVLVALVLLVLAACGSSVAGAPSGQPGGTAVQAKVPVELRPVLSMHPGTIATAPDELAGPDGVYTLGPSIGDFTSFTSVAAEHTDYGWVVTIKLPSDTAAVVASWTGAHVGDQLAIVVNHTLLSAPKIADAITGGALQISGNFTEQSAKDLATQITGS
ncbi:SecDF P1 head subdomain-containing protein [Actinokineospora inagensis]|uniref:SecDF P1 head subdomain-containing protein n=1 Tax=Actinokineospora inagensis TaxID=103730 RepID=UPI00047B5BE0|nr:hypothetical protein [Actinokineospora inagensis]